MTDRERAILYAMKDDNYIGARFSDGEDEGKKTAVWSYLSNAMAVN